MCEEVNYRLVDTPTGFQEAAEALAAGRGPFAVDTERASTFRYGDRAFLIQVQREDAGTFLIAPEGHRADATRALSPVLNGETWILHAAASDLPCLSELGLCAGSLFDTEVAARIAGYQRPNLANMVERICGVVLEKGHGREDWSKVPLPREWQDYAALDVAYLTDLADGLAEELAQTGKLDFAEQEFAYILDTSSSPRTGTGSWRDLKGASRISSALSMQLARALWTAREAQAKRSDRSPSNILQNRVLVDIALAQPTTIRDVMAVPGFPRRRKDLAAACLDVMAEAREQDRSTWPSRPKSAPTDVPSKSTMRREYPALSEALEDARDEVADLADALNMEASTIATTKLLRAAVWKASHSLHPWDVRRAQQELSELGARPWQCELVAPIIAAAGLSAADE